MYQHTCWSKPSSSKPPLCNFIFSIHSNPPSRCHRWSIVQHLPFHSSLPSRCKERFPDQSTKTSNFVWGVSTYPLFAWGDSGQKRATPSAHPFVVALITGTCDGLCVPISDTYGSRQNIQSTKCRYRKSISGSHRQQPLFVPHSLPSSLFLSLPLSTSIYLSLCPIETLLSLFLPPTSVALTTTSSFSFRRLSFFRFLQFH